MEFTAENKTDEELLKVSEFAKIAGVSRQAIYSRIDNQSIKCKVVGKQKYVYKSELEKFLVNQVVNQEYDNHDTKVNQDVKSFDTVHAMQQQIDIMKKHISWLESQLNVKDEQISNLLKQIEILHKLIDQEQKLHLANIGNVEILEKSEADVTEVDNFKSSSETPSQSQTKPRKFWSFFKRRS